jgi:hypothetical protein
MNWLKLVEDEGFLEKRLKLTEESGWVISTY